MQHTAIFPKELTNDIPKIMMTGNQVVYIEQHKGLLGYQDDEIILRTAIGRLRIGGKQLCFRMYTACDALISGEIDMLHFQEEG